jgi:hypothetical protein
MRRSKSDGLRRRAGAKLDSSVIVAVAAVWMVQVSVHQVVGMIAVRDLLVAAMWTVMMVRIVVAALVIRSTTVLIGLADFDAVLVDMTIVLMVQMSIVQIVCVAVMLKRRMTAVRAMTVGVFFVNLASFFHKKGGSSNPESCHPGMRVKLSASHLIH